MKLSAVRRNAELTVDAVEEEDPGDNNAARRFAELTGWRPVRGDEVLPGLVNARLVERVGIAGRRRKFRDHRGMSTRWVGDR